MSTLRTSEKTYQAVLPQRLALEPASVDNPGAGTKRGAGDCRKARQLACNLVEGRLAMARSSRATL